MNICNRPLYQAQIPLKMLRLSRHNQNTSLHTMMEGNFDFNETLFAPPGTNIIVHENSNRRRAWGHNGVQGWYKGPEFEHYECYKVYISKTRSGHIVDTVELFSDKTTMKGIYYANTATHMITYAISALKNIAPAALFSPLRIEKLDALRKLADISQGKTKGQQT